MASPTVTERDARHLERAIELAATARGLTSPNPMVGAVIVKSGRVIGEGLHTRAGEAHAERAALTACADDPAGSTLYVSLEPCCHQGRTPPCTEAIVEAGIARVVVASDDPTLRPRGGASASCATRESRSRRSRAIWRLRPACSTSPSASTRAPADRW